MKKYNKPTFAKAIVAQQEAKKHRTACNNNATRIVATLM